MSEQGPCMICGAIDYELSVGGPSICPSCDCGNFGPDAVQRLGRIIIELRERLATAERLVRVDQALARQLARSMQANVALQKRIRELEQGASPHG